MAKPRLVQAPLPLEYTEQTPTRRVANHKAGPSHLWLAIQFPNIAIEISHPQAKTSASVTAQTVKGRLVVCSTSALAEETGIHIGMAVNAAYALCPGVHVFEHDEKRVANTMTELAAWAMQYTSYVSLYNSNTLLLEIRGSLKLFGQLENIKTSIKSQLQLQGHDTILSCTPSPSASYLLTCFGAEADIFDTDQLRSALGDIPIAVLDVNQKTKKRLANIGTQTLRDLWRLPKPELRKRFGNDFVLYLDHLTADSPEVQKKFAPKATFTADSVFYWGIEDCESLLLEVKKLVLKFIDYLRKTDLCTSSYRFNLYHFAEKDLTGIDINLRKADRDVDYIFSVLEKYFDKLQLKGKIYRLELCVDKLEYFHTKSETMLENTFHEETAIYSGQNKALSELIDQLQNRLGSAHITGIGLVNDYRPEHAYQFSSSATNELSHYRPDRPLALLPEASSLNVDVSLISGPERLQTAWWSENKINRDYYIAKDKAGRRLWIYHDLSKRQWFIHGLFA